MCGIAGIINYKGEKANFNAIGRMVSFMKHRGPDDEGFETLNEGKVLLGHRQLNILTLAMIKHQPMCNSEKTVSVVYDGEIYNCEELNEKLRAKGYAIKDRCDTETLLRLYEEYGENCLDYLNGVFSFAIWDEKKKILFAAVDRLGVKPFYHMKTDDCFVFASELGSLTLYGDKKPDLEPESIHHYLSNQSPIAPKTIFKNIYRLPGGYKIVVDRNGNVIKKQYWKILFENGVKNLTKKEIKKEIRKLIQTAVKRRAVKDIPIGAFVSGGIDSSIVVGLMSQYAKEPVKTFSVAFDVEDPSYNELYTSSIIATKFRTDHKEVIVSSEDIVLNLKDYIYHIDQPSMDAISSFLGAKTASTDAKVVLSGMGGDELFCGYGTSYVLKHSRIEKFFRSSLSVRFIKPILFLINYLIEKGLCSNFFKKIYAYTKGFNSVGKKIFFSRALSMEFEKRKLYTKDFLRKVNEVDTMKLYENALKEIKDTSIINKITYLDILMYMENLFLRDIDAASMANSLEVRMPLIDYEVVEFILKIPTDLRYNKMYPKCIFVETFKDMLPQETLDKEKRGFMFPFNIWLRGRLSYLIDLVLSKERIASRGIFKYREVKKVIDKFNKQKSKHIWKLIWGLITLELWLSYHYDDDSSLFDQIVKEYYINNPKASSPNV